MIFFIKESLTDKMELEISLNSPIEEKEVISLYEAKRVIGSIA